MEYVEYGWPLIPIVPPDYQTDEPEKRGKEPHSDLLRDIYADTRLKHLKSAPASLVEVEYWFENDSNINLAVIPCERAGIVIVDIDDLSLMDVNLETPTVSSGRVGGGKHFYFSCSQVVPRKKMRRDGLAWGDLNPLYVLLPGSIHRSSRMYEWLEGLSPEDVPFMPFDSVAHIFECEGLVA